MSRAAAIALSVSVCLTSIVPVPANAAKPPTRVGQCVDTFVAKLGTRLVDGNTGQPIADSGTAIQFSNGVWLVSYEAVPNAEASRAGDRVKMCLQSVPENCPPGDDRGKVYQISNYRTGKRFTLPDSQHLCGGA